MTRIALVMIVHLALSTGRVQGLELSLDLDSPATSGHRPVCGVLICEEDYTDHTPNASPAGGASTGRSILSLSIFKGKQPSSSGGLDTRSSNGGRGNPFVALTVQQPTISRVSNGVKVDGVLEARRATVRLEIVKDVDCAAEFSCEVRVSDGQGNDFVHTNRLHQRPEQPMGKTSGPGMASKVFSHDPALLQQQITSLGVSLDSKLDTIETRLGERLEESLESRLESKFESLIGKFGALDGKFGLYENNLGALNGRFDTLETRLGEEDGEMMTRLDTAEDTLKGTIISTHNKLQDAIDTRVVKKLGEIVKKQQSVDSDIDVFHQRLDEIKENLKTLEQEVKDGNEEVSRLNDQTITNTTREILAALDVHMNGIQTLEQMNQQRFDEILEANEKVINFTGELQHRLRDDFSALYDSFDADFTQLKTAVHNSSMQALSAVRELIDDANATVHRVSEHLVGATSSPKVCKKASWLDSSSYHMIEPNNNSELDVPFVCDLVTESGGWVVLQRRSSGATDFYRTWAEYRDGFGNLDDEFWLGNKYIHALTSKGKYELRVEITYNGNSKFAHYSSFSLDGEDNNYALRVGGYGGTAGDSLSYHNGKPFSTYDNDHDGYPDNRAAQYAGAWWYDGGYYSNLNAKWGTNGITAARWSSLTGRNAVSLSEMKIRKL